MPLKHYLLARSGLLRFVGLSGLFGFLGQAGLGAAEPARLRFEEVPGAGGIGLTMTSGSMPSREILEVNGGGVALFDYDNDGDQDVFLANGATLADPEHGPGSRLYANQGDGTFEDVTVASGIALRRWAMGAVVGDYDGDGWDDLYVTCFGPNVLLRNAAAPGGGRRFHDVAAAAGVADPRWSTSAAFADLDGDRDLDLYVVNYLRFDPASPPRRAGNAYKGRVVMAGPRGLEGASDVLYENLGGGRFRDVTEVAGFGTDTATEYGLGVRILDFDGDLEPDIFVGNDSTADRLWRNRGQGSFEDVAAVAGVAANGSGTTQASMGIGQLDADGNGAPDLFVTVFSDDTNTLHLNLGDGFFDDRSAQFGLAAISRRTLGWGCGFFDFDLDGDEDLFVANGHVYPETDDPRLGGSWAQVPSLLTRRGGRFEPVECVDPWCGERYHGRATAFGDLDGDRDVDLVMTTLNGPVKLLRNLRNLRDLRDSRKLRDLPSTTAAEGPSLAVRLAGLMPNHRALGSLVEVESATATQRRWLSGGGSFQSTDAVEAIFGFAQPPPSGKVRVSVLWPEGARSRLVGVPIDRRLVIVRRASPGLIDARGPG